jgi:hypothetical protein
MTKKADFNAEEWDTVVEGPVFAGLAVIAADRGGTIRESLAMGRVYQEARQQQGQSDLLDDLVGSQPSIDKARAQESGGDVAAIAKERLTQAMSLLEAKATPDEIDAYKKFVMTVAQAAAAAHKEGGFLGIGGQKVSEAEETALDEISLTLGPPPSSGTA